MYSPTLQHLIDLVVQLCADQCIALKADSIVLITAWHALAHLVVLLGLHIVLDAVLLRVVYLLLLDYLLLLYLHGGSVFQR